MGESTPHAACRSGLTIGPRASARRLSALAADGLDEIGAGNPVASMHEIDRPNSFSGAVDSGHFTPRGLAAHCVTDRDGEGDGRSKMGTEDTRLRSTPRAGRGVATVLRRKPGAQDGIPPGTLLVNTYRVERLLGGGGMGEVYLARHMGLGTEHAVKVIRPSLARDRQIMALFYREAKVLRGVRHDAVVSYDGFVRDAQGRDYLVMEYAAGPSLSERMSSGPLPPAEVLALRDRLAAGLAEAHRKGAVHRDISPDNVILPGERIEAAKLIDFGISKLTDPTQESIIGSAFAGKFRFASPEQFGLFGGVVDARSDIYSLGLVLAAASRGQPLDMGDTFEAALRSRQSVPDLGDIPADLRDWLEAMLQPDPARRPESMRSIVEHWPARRPRRSGAARRGPQQRLGRDADRRIARRGPGRWLVVAAGLALLGTVGGGLYWRFRAPPPISPEPAPHPDSELTLTPPGPLDIAPGPSSQPDEAAPERPPAAEDIAALTGSGRLDDAFALAQARIEVGDPPAQQETWVLAQALQRANQADRAFALARELANADHGPAAFLLAEMYDPLHWSKEKSPFSKPNARKASEWYRRAAEAGVGDAGARLKALAVAEQEHGQNR